MLLISREVLFLQRFYAIKLLVFVMKVSNEFQIQFKFEHILSLQLVLDWSLRKIKLKFLFEYLSQPT